MAWYNLIFASLFGLAAVAGGAVGQPLVFAKFSEELKAKAVPTPGRINPDGSQGQETMEISAIDRQESAERWERYQEGVRYTMYHALALGILGAVGGGGRGPTIAGVGFATGTLLYGGGMALGALFNEPLLAVTAPIGGIFLLVGWGGLLVTLIASRFAKPTSETAVSD